MWCGEWHAVGASGMCVLHRSCPNEPTPFRDHFFTVHFVASPATKLTKKTRGAFGRQAKKKC